MRGAGPLTMQGHKDSHETTALSKMRAPDERTDGGGASGERHSTEEDAAAHPAELAKTRLRCSVLLQANVCAHQ